MRCRHRSITAAAVLAATLTIGGTAAAATPPLPGPDPNGPTLTPIGFTVTPAGQQTDLGDLPLGEALSPDGSHLVVSNDGQGVQSLQLIDTSTGDVTQTLDYPDPAALYTGLAFSPDGHTLYASGGGNNLVRSYGVGDHGLAATGSFALPTSTPKGAKVNPFPAGIAVTPDGGRLVVADQQADAVSVIDVGTSAVHTIAAGHRPYGVALSKDGRTAYVTSQGGNDVAVVDVSGATPVAQRSIQVGTHPNKIIASTDGSTLYVANGDSDEVSVIDTASDKVTRTINLAPYPDAPVGSNPDALALSHGRPHALRRQRGQQRRGGGRHRLRFGHGADPHRLVPHLDRDARRPDAGHERERAGSRTEQRAQPPRPLLHLPGGRPVLRFHDGGHALGHRHSAAGSAADLHPAGEDQRRVRRRGLGARWRPGHEHHPEAPGRADPDQARDLRGAREPDLRPGVRQPRQGQRRRVARPVRRRVRPQLPQLGEDVRRLRQLLRRRRGQRPGLELDGGGELQPLRRTGLAGQLLRPQRAVPVGEQRPRHRTEPGPGEGLHLGPAGREPRVLPQLRLLRRHPERRDLEGHRPAAPSSHGPPLPRLRPRLPRLARDLPGEGVREVRQLALHGVEEGVRQLRGQGRPADRRDAPAAQRPQRRDEDRLHRRRGPTSPTTTGHWARSSTPCRIPSTGPRPRSS